MPEEIMKAGESRVWLFENGVGPGKDVEYLGCGRIGDPTYNFGDMTRIECPSSERYNEFEEVGSFQGTKERPTASIIARYPRLNVSKLLRAGRRRCRVDVHAHIGKCGNPQDYGPGGWEKIVVFPSARITSFTGANWGAMGTDEQNAANKTAEISAKDMYEIARLRFDEQCAAEVAREIVGIVVCDSIECGDCDKPSDGCQKLLAVQLGTGATPGTLPSVVYSSDGGDTCAATDIDTLYSNEDPTDVACVGADLVVISTEGGVHLAPIADILAGTETWVEQSAGMLMYGGTGPTAIWSADAQHTWVVGEAGYIYFSSNPRAGWVIQDPGVATVRNLMDVHALNAESVVAVGEFNSVVATENGGNTWQTIAGPAPGETLNCVWMYDEWNWLVGTSTGGFYWTDNKGVTWTNVAADLPVTIVEIDEIIFHDDTVGYMAARDGAAHGIILRTVDGGMRWHVLPEASGNVIPDNDRINMLAVCADPNIVWGGGLGPAGTDGIIIKAA